MGQGSAEMSNASVIKNFIDSNWSSQGYYARAIGDGMCEVVLPQDIPHLEWFVEDAVAAGCNNVHFTATADEVRVELYCNGEIASHLRTSVFRRGATWVMYAVLWLVSVLIATVAMQKLPIPESL